MSNKIIKGDVELDRLHLTELPDLSDVEVDGDFYCDNNQLTSLEGAPREVVGGFDCDNNQLTSLEGSPREVGGGFYCSNNKLTSLKGIPRNIGGNFYIMDNAREFTEEEIRSVCKVKGEIYV